MVVCVVLLNSLIINVGHPLQQESALPLCVIPWSDSLLSLVVWRTMVLACA